MSQPVLGRDQVRQVDRYAIDELGMSGLVLMENAGRGCTDRLCELGISGTVAIACGRGNNAGDGFVIARHLDNRGYAAKVLLWCEPEVLQGDAADNFCLLAATDVPIVVFEPGDGDAELGEALEDADWIVDALLGTGAIGDPRPPLDAVIERLNAHPAKKLAIDLPSGLDCDTGRPGTPTFRADYTCTMVASKPGFHVEGAAQYTGIVSVHDIGVPQRIVEEIAEGQ